MTKPIKYKDVDINLIKIHAPEKLEGEKYYTSKITYGADTFNLLDIQTPILNIETSDIIKFGLVKNGNFFNLMDTIHTRLLDIIYTNSEKFFKGKKFSEEHIKRALCRLAVETDQSQEQFFIKLNCKMSQSVKVYDSFKETCSLLTPCKSKVILRLSGLIFKGTTIEPVLEITHIKIDYKNNKKKQLECILEDGSEAEPEVPEEVPVEVPEEVEEIIVEVPIEEEIEKEEIQVSQFEPETSEFF